MILWKLTWRWRAVLLTAISVGLLISPLQDIAHALERIGASESNEVLSDQAFQVWIEELRNEARGKGISRATLDAALRDVAPVTRVIKLDRRQAEFTQTFWTYLRKTVTNERINRGRALLAKYHELLNEIYVRCGVPPRYLIAFWGLETNFGDNQGSFLVIDALVTLAYDHRRADFFRAQLLGALQIIEEGHIAPDKMAGSWAGAMGHMQFMPTTFIEHAVDYTGNGRKDIWSSLPDAFCSAANYLSNLGWRRSELWGREVRLPKDFDPAIAMLSEKKSMEEWSALGVQRAYSQPLPQAQMEGSILLPQGYNGPAFLVYNNFRVILQWNRSIKYAISVGHLADRIIGLPQIVNGRETSHEQLSRNETEEIQRLLNLLGFDAGVVDGLPGPRTRSAIRAFQKKYSLPPDGYPAPALLQRLRVVAADLQQEGY